MKFINLNSYVVKQTLVAACLNIAEILNGYALGWSSPVIPKLMDKENTPFSNVISETESTWIVSFIYMGIISAFITSLVLNKIGRRPCFIAGGFLYVIANTILAASTNIQTVYAGRAIVGLAMSSLSLCNVVYIGEIASTNIRGKILTATGFFHALGSLIVYCIGPYMSYAGLCYTAIGISLLYVTLIFFVPESPVYYVIKGNEEAARESLRCLGRTKDINSELKTMMEKAKETQANTYLWHQIFTVKPNRRSLYVTIPLFFFQQSSGVMAIVGFSTTIFQSAGSDVEPNIATMITGATMVFGAIFSPMFVEKCGRRVLLIISTCGCSISLGILSLYFYFDKTDHLWISSVGWIPLLCLIFVLFSYSVGFNIIPQTIAGEMFAPNVRGLGSFVSLSTGWLSGFVTTTIFGYVVAAYGMDASFWMFAVINAAAFIFIIFVVPETKGKSLTEINIMMAKEEK